MDKELIKRELDRRKKEKQDAIIKELFNRNKDDWGWRVTSGLLYKIKNKEAEIVPYNPNKQQLRLRENQTNRNVVPKARQL